MLKYLQFLSCKMHKRCIIKLKKGQIGIGNLQINISKKMAL